MIVLDEAMVAASLPYDRLIPALRTGLARDWRVPRRIHYDMPGGASTLLMPAWDDANIGLKVVNVFPGNAARGKAPISSTYLLYDGLSGEPKALIDGETLTVRRTAAITALAASLLAPVAADHMLIIGSGRIARELPAALAAVRPIRRVTVWSRHRDHAAALVRMFQMDGYEAIVCDDLARSVAEAPVIACATLSTEPIIRGAWLTGEFFLSLIGGFRPDMREVDSEAVRRSYVVADTRDGVLAQAGDILTPITEGVVRADHVKADLFDLCRDAGKLTFPPGPRMFKSVGHAAQDLLAATLCMALMNTATDIHTAPGRS